MLNRLERSWRKWPAACVVLLGLAYSVLLHTWLGMDGLWDTANYHWYIGWAALNLSPYDFGAVAQYHTYLNPLIDALNFATFSFHPYLGALIQSVVFSLAILVTYLIAIEITAEGKYGCNVLVAFAVAAMGATGALAVSLFGSFTNEHFTALIILWALLLTVRNIDAKELAPFLAIGLLLGIAVGCKLTAAPYVVGLFFAIVVATRLDMKIALLTCVGVGSGLLLTDGPFMVLRWLNVGNPIFPFANNIFDSPYFAAQWKSFSSFELELIPYYLSLPFTWLSAADTSEASTLRDGRFLLIYIGFAFIVAARICKKKLDKKRMVIVFFVLVSWLVWIMVFRVYRYLLMLELVSGLMLLIGLETLFGTKRAGLKLGVLLLASYFLYTVTVYPNWGRRPWQNEFVKNELSSMINSANADVVFFADMRLSYFAPQLHVEGIAFRNLLSQPWYEGDRLGNPIDPESFALTPGTKVHVMQYTHLDPRSESDHLTGLFPNEVFQCKEVASNMLWRPYLCSFDKLPDVPVLRLEEPYNHLSDRIIFASGWSNPEADARWTEGKRSTFWFRTDPVAKDCHLKVTLNGHTFGEQLIGISVNGADAAYKAGDGAIEVTGSTTVSHTTGKEPIRVDLLLPDATTVGRGDPKLVGITDPRVLGLALQQFRATCSD